MYMLLCKRGRHDAWTSHVINQEPVVLGENGANILLGATPGKPARTATSTEMMPSPACTVDVGKGLYNGRKRI